MNASCVFPKWDIPTSSFLNWRHTLQSRSQLNFTGKTRTALTQHSWSNVLVFLLKNKLLTAGGRKESFCCDNCKAHKKGNFLPDLHLEMSQLLPNSLGYQQKESTEICKYLKISKQIPGEEWTKKKWGKGCQQIQRCHRLGAAFLKPLGSSHQGQPRKAMAWGHPRGPALKRTWSSKANRGCAGCDVGSSLSLPSHTLRAGYLNVL